MKKLTAFICIFITLLFTSCNKEIVYTHAVYEVTIEATELRNNYVGTDWKRVYTCNGKIIDSGDTWTVPLNAKETITIDIEITEVDKWSETGKGSISVILQDQYETSTTITVTENKGRYKGNQAEWEIVCQVSLAEKIEKTP